MFNKRSNNIFELILLCLGWIVCLCGDRVETGPHGGPVRFMVLVCSFWEAEAECGAEECRKQTLDVGNLRGMSCAGGSRAGVPESCVVCVTMLWTNPISFSCI